METITDYRCECCANQYKTPKEAEACEAQHRRALPSIAVGQVIESSYEEYGAFSISRCVRYKGTVVEVDKSVEFQPRALVELENKTRRWVTWSYYSEAWRG